MKKLKHLLVTLAIGLTGCAEIEAQRQRKMQMYAMKADLLCGERYKPGTAEYAKCTQVITEDLRQQAQRESFNQILLQQQVLNQGQSPSITCHHMGAFTTCN